MIPNALATTGSYAELWGQLKSMRHAIDRALSAPRDLEELDRDRLVALKSFLAANAGLAPAADARSLFEAYVTEQREDYGADLDLRESLRHVEEFRVWRKAAKTSMDAKLQGLVAALDAFVEEKPNESLFVARAVPKEEFEILRSVLSSLISEVQSSVYATTVLAD